MRAAAAAGDPADWLTNYAVIYRYHGVVFEADSAYIRGLADKIGRTLEAIVAHIYRISGMSPPKTRRLSLSERERDLPAIPTLNLTPIDTLPAP